MYRVTKTYGHEQGFSCAFRQWRAEGTHCRFVHGYALKVQLVFEGPDLDHRNWLISFGELKEVKQYLQDTFDHQTCIAHDDPHLDTFMDLEEDGLIQLQIVPHVGIEKFAEMVYDRVNDYILADKLKNNGVRLVEVSMWEHEGNCATYAPNKQKTASIADIWTLPPIGRSTAIISKKDPNSYLVNARVGIGDAPATTSGSYDWTGLSPITK